MLLLAASVSASVSALAPAAPAAAAAAPAPAAVAPAFLHHLVCTPCESLTRFLALQLEASQTRARVLSHDLP